MKLEDAEERSGLRERFVTPAPPAPVPEPRTPAATTATGPDFSSLTVAPGSPTPTSSTGRDASGSPRGAAQAPGRSGTHGDDGTSGRPEDTATGQADAGGSTSTSDSDVVRSTGTMAIATLISRLTGFIRTVMIGSSLGTAVASAFNTANILPNLITEIVLGAVLTSLVVPVLVRAEREDADHGRDFVRRLFTLAFSVLGVVTVVAVAGAPLLTVMALNREGHVNISQSTAFAYLLLPQILFYGLFALFMAVLNTKNIFGPGAWAPVANNVISIAVLAAYQLVPGTLDPKAPASIADPHVLLLGLGTTLGVVTQMAIMLPSLKRAGVDLRPLWGIDARLRQFGGMALAIVVYVAISQAGWLITNNVASLADSGAPMIYQQAWLLLQVPYGVIGVTLLTAIMPRLSRNAAAGDDRNVVRDLTMATKLTLLALIPVIVFFMGFGPQVGEGLFQYGQFQSQDAHILGLTLTFSAFTLIPYALVLLHLRVFYAREEAWTPTFIIAGITGTKVLLSLMAPHVASSPHHVVILLGAANGFGFVAGALIGARLLRRKLGSLHSREVLRTSAWALIASLAGLVAAYATWWILDRFLGHFLHFFGSLGTLVGIGIAGVVFLIATGVVLSFSHLPEVQSLGALLQRLPGLRRFIRVTATEHPAVEQPTKQEMGEQLFAADPFSSTPIPPPMSAGVVRGPRLVPGAPVSDGRFRLLMDHGSAPGARFWQAREQRTGRQVALVFVDTSGSAPLAPASPEHAATVAAEVTRRTRQLARLQHPAVARSIEVTGYRSGCLVVADWVEGSPLKKVAGLPDVNSRAAVYALADLADAAGCARDAGLALGLDNWARVRITTDGRAVLAFPAVMPGASLAADLGAVSSCLNLLVRGEGVPEDVRLVKAAVAECSEDPETNARAARQVARELRRVGLAGAGAAPGAGEGGSSPAARPRDISVPQERTPVVPAQAGFGSKSYSRSATGALAGLAILTAVAIAAAITLVVGYFGSGQPDAPVNTGGTQNARKEETDDALTPVLSAISVLQPEGYSEDADNPGDARLAVDGNVDTVWRSDAYPGGLNATGTKPGVGLLVELQSAVTVDQLLVTAPSGGATYSVYVLDEEPTGLPDADPAVMGTLEEGSNTVAVAGDTASRYVLLWFTGVPVPSTTGDNTVAAAEISVVGHVGDSTSSSAVTATASVAPDASGQDSTVDTEPAD